MTAVSSNNYSETLKTLKEKIKTAQIRSGLAVNKELITLYWEIGKTILEKQESEGWGAKVIQRLAKDLTSSFTNIKGFSVRNLKYMRKFAETYPDFQIVQELLAQITLGA